MLKGTVKWFDKRKGYGFISCDQDHADIFVHYTGFKDTRLKTLNDGDVVLFNIIKGEKGPKAQDVELKTSAN